MSMIEKIDKMLEERFACGEDGLRKYDDDGVHIAYAIEELFEEEEFFSADYSVECETIFSSPAVDLTYVSIAFLDWGKLHHTVYIVEA